ncbi:hypothetical protein E4U42_005178 [Claviceps africana]|uniref:Integral membrane bound transporter domain-containing protein n=1 Tax=Claviceps africana TaxID=83212 RepID=A0A8K0J6A4_9HYPO|nr:hypothetical protein E4U42_005178 [Claviceps africana]
MASPSTPPDDGRLRDDAIDLARPVFQRRATEFALRLPVAERRADQQPSDWAGRRPVSRQCHRAVDFAYSQLLHALDWLDSVQGRGVLKCTFAYTIASLATFVGPLSDFLGRPDGKHVVATITVYFHAARSAGSMMEATLIAMLTVAYAETISILSMVTSVLVGSKLGLVTLAHALVIIVFIGGGFGFLGWVKQRMNNPLLNVGSTLASVANIAVVTKEGAVVSGVFSYQKITQVLKMLGMGITSSAAINLLVWPVFAKTQLRASMLKASTALGDALTAVSTSFLRGEVGHDEHGPDAISRASLSYRQAHAALLRNLREAKFEHFFVGHEDVYVVERSIVKAIETLAQSIGGLKSAAKTQQTLLSSGTVHRSCGGFDLFVAFTDRIRPLMQDLTDILSQVLHEPVFSGPHDYESRLNQGFRQILTERLDVFVRARVDALQHVYDVVAQRALSRDVNHLALEEIAAACGHFSFSLQSFGEEMAKYLDLLENLQCVSGDPKRSWTWLLWWRADEARAYSMPALPFESGEARSPVKPIRKAQFPRGIPESMAERRDVYAWHAFLKGSSILGRLSLRVLRILRRVAKDDSLGSSLWAMLAFLPDTRPLYFHYRGEWGLLSFMIVCSMTVGASNTTGWARFAGTFLGGAFSVMNWNVSQGNAVALVGLGWCVSFFNFYLIVARDQAPLGRMTLLAYNVSTLYAYSLSQKVDGNHDDDDEGGVHPLIMEIVKHRGISVTVGILWGLIVCRLVWPISARRKFKESVAVLFLQMGLIWRRGPLAILLRSDCSQSFLQTGEQAALQRYADRLEGLRHAAASEFELRGPFPFESQGRIMQSANRILDSFFAMSLVTQPRERLTSGEKALLRFTAAERAELCDGICHIFQVLASSVMLEYSLTDAVPSTLSLRDRLLSKIFRFRAERLEACRDADAAEGVLARGENNGSRGSAEALDVTEGDYALLYAYVLVTGQVADELGVAAAEMESLFGGLDEEARLLES